MLRLSVAMRHPYFVICTVACLGTRNITTTETPYSTLPFYANQAHGCRETGGADMNEGHRLDTSHDDRGEHVARFSNL